MHRRGQGAGRIPIAATAGHFFVHFLASRVEASSSVLELEFEMSPMPQPIFCFLVESLRLLGLLPFRKRRFRAHPLALVQLEAFQASCANGNSIAVQAIIQLVGKKV